MQQGLSLDLAHVMAEAVATGLFRSLATFYKPVKTQGPTGNYVGTTTAVAGMTNIPCMDAPFSIGQPKATEDKMPNQTLAESFRHVLLDAWYPLASGAAPNWGWQVDIDGTLFDLLGAESDSQSTQTRLRLQRVTL